MKINGLNIRVKQVKIGTTFKERKISTIIPKSLQFSIASETRNWFLNLILPGEVITKCYALSESKVLRSRIQVQNSVFSALEVIENQSNILTDILKEKEAEIKQKALDNYNQIINHTN